MLRGHPSHQQSSIAGGIQRCGARRDARFPQRASHGRGSFLRHAFKPQGALLVLRLALGRLWGAGHPGTRLKCSQGPKHAHESRAEGATRVREQPALSPCGARV